MAIKVAVVYHSQTGNTARMADIIAQGAQSVEGAEARAISITDMSEADAAYIAESRCLVYGDLVVGANLSAPGRAWLEGPAKKLNMNGKLGGAFATARYVYGGGEHVIREILGAMLVMGMLPYSGGCAQGKPFIHLGPVAIEGHLEESEEVFGVFGERMARKAVELFA